MGITEWRMIVLFSFSAGQRCQTDIHCVSLDAYLMLHSPCLASHSHAPVVCTTISVCFRGRGWGKEKNELGREMSTGPSVLCVCKFFVFCVWALSFPHWYSRSLWILQGTSMGRRTLRPMKTQWTLQMSCHWSMWRPPEEQRRCNAHKKSITRYTSNKFERLAEWWLHDQNKVRYLALITILCLGWPSKLVTALLSPLAHQCLVLVNNDI